MKLHTHGFYFVIVLLIRGSASALFKALCISLIMKKPLKTKKAKINFLFITIPSVLLFLVKKAVLALRLDHASVLHFFLLFMVVSRCIRALVKVLKAMRGEKVKKRTRHNSLQAKAPIYLGSESNVVASQIRKIMSAGDMLALESVVPKPSN